MGTLTRKIHSQPGPDVITPPAMTPTDPAEPLTAPKIASAFVRGGPSRNVPVRSTARQSRTARPCARFDQWAGSEFDNPAASDAAVKTEAGDQTARPRRSSTPAEQRPRAPARGDHPTESDAHRGRSVRRKRTTLTTDVKAEHEVDPADDCRINRIAGRVVVVDMHLPRR